MDNKENRVAEQLEVRAIDDKPSVLVGYAVRWDSPTTIGGQFQEEFKRGAFSEALSDSDIRALVDHDTSKVLGRNKSGTLRLAEDDTGLRVEIDPPDTSVARDLVELVKRGDVSGMSFGFNATEQRWDHSTKPSKRTVSKARLAEVSVVTFPAYLDTSIAVRSMEASKARALKEELESKLNDRLNKKES